MALRLMEPVMSMEALLIVARPLLGFRNLICNA
jgi:hypothetical protein